MGTGLIEALHVLLSRDHDGALFDREAPEYPYRSQGLEDARRTIRTKPMTSPAERLRTRTATTADDRSRWGPFK
ncbi:dihydrolipoamide acyltransferase, (E2) component [Sphingopyxis macrogoltabida]|nr:dihydrolipoamide acyltransferase, (E2) component [Sphingopyxis macrogoltabida]